ncbi:MAG: NYN domain-containing protein [Armatimonadota bacterium]|nr:NYN domain-containing protein [Armatimonadota bacterium]MDR5696639.1 NYN domain-containing protein [Armatimonadota bacterium]
MDREVRLRKIEEWLAEDERTVRVLVGALYPGRALATLATRLGVTYVGHRITKVPRPELLDAVAETVRQHPGERTRLAEELLEGAQEQLTAVQAIASQHVARWIAGTGSAEEGMKRLVAAIVDERPRVGRSARSWWRRFLADATRQQQLRPEEMPTQVLNELVRIASEPLQAASERLTSAAKDLRDVLREAAQYLRRVDQDVARQAAHIDRKVQGLGDEITRVRSWFGEQQGSVRRSLEELTSAIRSLESRLDRHQQATEELVRRLAGVAVALERGQVEAARRELTRVRSGKVRVGIFADVANLYFSARDAHGSRVHYGALMARGQQLGEVAVARAYVTEGSNAEGQAAFEAALRHIGFEVKVLHLRRLSDGRHKANWDLGMATDILVCADDLDVVLLATGDGDFVDLVRWLRRQGLQVHVAGVAGHTAGELISAADGWIPLEGDLLMPARQRS